MSNPRDPGVSLQARQHLEQAYAHEEEHEFENARRECELAIQLATDWAEAHNLLGIVLEEAGRTEQSIAAYRRAVDLDPAFPEARENLMEAQAELRQKKWSSLFELVTIRTFSYPTPAYLAQGLLEAYDILSWVADDRIVGINWLYSNAVGGVKLRVRQEDIRTAVQLLDKIDKPRDHIVGHPHCPSCHSAVTHFEKYAWRLLFLSWLILKFPLPFMKQKWHCENCGHEWQDSTDGA